MIIVLSIKMWNYIRKHWIKISVITVIIFTLFPVLLVPFILAFAIVFSEIVNGTSYRFSNYIDREVKVAPFAVLYKKSRTSGEFKSNYLYLSTGAIAHHFLRDSKDSGISLDNYSKFKVVDVKLWTSELIRIDELCLMKNPDISDFAILEDCENISKIDEVTKLFQEAELDIKKFGSTYLTVDKEYASELLTPVLESIDSKTYKVNSREQLVGLLTHKDLPLDDYSWIMHAHPLLIKDRRELDDKTR